MKDMLAWLENNKQWVFSGVGVLGLTLIGALLKRGRSNDKGLMQNHSITQAPTVMQAPVLHITTNVDTSSKPPEPIAISQATTPIKPNQAPLFALNPLAVERDLVTVTGSIIDDAMEVCIARFKMHEEMTDWIPNRFEASIDYVQRLSASGIPYEHRAGHINQARWLTSSNDVHELILIVKRSSTPYAVTGIEDEDGYRLGEGSLVPLDVPSPNSIFATAELTDTTNGQKWEAEYAIEFNTHGELAVRQTGKLHRG